MIKHHIYFLLYLNAILGCNTRENPQIKISNSQEANPAESNENITEIKNQDNILNEIGATSKYIWESINEEAITYTTLALDNGTFRLSVCTFEACIQNLKKAIDLDGKWQLMGNNQINGIIGINGAQVSWTTSSDFTSITNNKGVVFRRINMNSQDTDSKMDLKEINPEGTYSYHDNSADLQIIVSGESWTGKTNIISGLGNDYDEKYRI